MKETAKQTLQNLLYTHLVLLLPSFVWEDFGFGTKSIINVHFDVE